MTAKGGEGLTFGVMGKGVGKWPVQGWKRTAIWGSNVGSNERSRAESVEKPQAQMTAHGEDDEDDDETSEYDDSNDDEDNGEGDGYEDRSGRDG